MNCLKLLSFLVIATGLLACGDNGSHPDKEHAHEESGTHDEAAEPEKGAHGGRLLRQGPVTVELEIAEDGIEPTYRAWLYLNDKPQPSGAGQVEVELTRLGGVKESHQLRPREDGSLMADTVVGEPHSFDVAVSARVDGQQARWEYPSYEGRTVIAGAIADEAGIRVAPAAAGVIADQHEVQGLLTPVEGRLARVAARYPGSVRELRAGVGDRVRAGQVLAVLDSNLSLSSYSVSTPIDGVVLARNAALGGVASEGDTLFEVADLSALWVDLHIFGADAQHIGPGAAVTVTRLGDGRSAETTLERILPGTATASQSAVARASLPNDDGMWRPGAAVRARVTVAEKPVPVAVPLAALQTFRDRDVVFVRVGDTYEARPVEPGQRDAMQVEILSGILPGDHVVVEQSYLVKADIEKSGASHDH